MPDDDLPGGDPRAFIQGLAEETGADPHELLFTSKRRDLMFKGTDADHRKAEWFARIWQHAVADRDVDAIHVRGVHYFLLMAQDETYGLDLSSLPFDLPDEDLPSLPGDLLSPPTPCSWDQYRNTDACFSYLKDAATLARALGYIPLDGLQDEKHAQRVVSDYRNQHRQPDTSRVSAATGVTTPDLPPVDARAESADGLDVDLDDSQARTAFIDWASETVARELARELSFDETSQAPYHIELWCEKTLPDYIHTLAQDLGVNAVVEGEGDLSLRIAHDFVERVEAANRPAVVLYLSDLDPKGAGMAPAMASKLAWFRQQGRLDERVYLDQLAITPEQVERYNLPSEPIDGGSGSDTGAQAYDTLVEEWEAEHGQGATELNVLEGVADLYRHIVRAGVEPYVDAELGRKNERAREQWRDDVQQVVADHLADVIGHGDLRQLAGWRDTYNDLFHALVEDLRTLHQHQRRGYLAEWEDTLDEALQAVTYPAVEAPEGEAEPPEDPLYDTARGYLENLKRLQASPYGR